MILLSLFDLNRIQIVIIIIKREIQNRVQNYYDETLLILLEILPIVLINLSFLKRLNSINHTVLFYCTNNTYM